jgi:dipeptidase D
LEHFLALTKIPHCSHEAEALRNYLVAFGRERGYRVEVDGADNVLIFKGKPQLCLQAHYDMVCMGKAPEIETYEEGGWLKAHESSLGADNGVAIAMMMDLMDEGLELEFLFTANEEVGLIGAGALNFPLYSSYMLNLDFEDEAEVCIGCAGGADIAAYKKDTLVEGAGTCYEVAVKDLAGGHSGVDIDKGIPSAIKIVGDYLYDHEITQMVSFHGGERANSIPANAVAIVRSETPLQGRDEIRVRELNEAPAVLQQGSMLIEMIHHFKHGVREQNEALGIPQSSINLAIITVDAEGSIQIETSARAMEMASLSLLTEETVGFFQKYGLEATVKDKYPAWKPEINSFTDLIGTHMKAVFGESKTMAIHAGLECGIISQKYPHIQFAAIGPTIRYPHSTREMVNLKSVEDTYAVLCRIVSEIELGVDIDR